jgi:hypothetical protein
MLGLWILLQFINGVGSIANTPRPAASYWRTSVASSPDSCSRRSCGQPDAGARVRQSTENLHVPTAHEEHDDTRTTKKPFNCHRVLRVLVIIAPAVGSYTDQQPEPQHRIERQHAGCRDEV